MSIFCYYCELNNATLFTSPERFSILFLLYWKLSWYSQWVCRGAVTQPVSAFNLGNLVEYVMGQLGWIFIEATCMHMKPGMFFSLTSFSSQLSYSVRFVCASVKILQFMPNHAHLFSISKTHLHAGDSLWYLQGIFFSLSWMHFIPVTNKIVVAVYWTSMYLLHCLL